ncbi:MAG: FecR domain-containing protein [Pseudomonadota bacterium]
MTKHRIGALALSILSFILGPMAAHAEVGTAVDVDQAATVTGTGGANGLQSGARVSVGDVIQTNRAGQVQLRFDDNTRIVVGPNSQFSIADIQMSSSNSANRFAVDAVRGSFRFISGKSPKNAFSIRTPNATIGIRGTTFDIEIDRDTILASLRGVVEVCANGGECQILRARCAVIVADRNGNIDLPSLTEAGQLIRSGFPYIEDQRPRLLPAFRASTRSCNRYALPRRVISDNEDDPRLDDDEPEEEEFDEEEFEEDDDFDFRDTF